MRQGGAPAGDMPASRRHPPDRPGIEGLLEECALLCVLRGRGNGQVGLATARVELSESRHCSPTARFVGNMICGAGEMAQ